MSEAKEIDEFLGELEKVANHYLLLHTAANGILYDPRKAEIMPCKCFTYMIRGEERLYCWVPGIIGAADEAQREKYCPPEKRIMLKREKIPERMKKFIKVASELCPAGMPLAERLVCISKEAAKVGIKF